MIENQEEVQGSQVIQGDLTVLGSINNENITALSTKLDKTQAAVESVSGDMGNLILGLADDGTITVAEKVTIRNTWDGIEAEYPSIYARGQSLGVPAETLDLFNLAYDALRVFLFAAPGILTDMTTASAVSKEEYRAITQAYINGRESVNGTIDVGASNELIKLGIKIDVSETKIKRDRVQTLMPAILYVGGRYSDGLPYKGRITIEALTGSVWTTVYTSTVDESDVSYTLVATINGEYVEAIRSSVKKAGGGGAVLQYCISTIEAAYDTDGRYWGSLAAAPTSGFIRGDYYFDNRAAEDGGGLLMYCTGTQWIEYAPVLEKYAQAKATALNDVLVWAGNNKGINNDIVSAANAIFETITAASAFIESLATVNVDILGSLRTGLQAATDARIAIQDYTGCSRVSFTYNNLLGAPLDDMKVTEDSTTPGAFTVQIDNSAAENTPIGSTGPGGGKVIYVDPNTGYALEALTDLSAISQISSISSSTNNRIEIVQAPIGSTSYVANPTVLQRYNATTKTFEFIMITDSNDEDGWICERRSNNGEEWSEPKKIFPGINPSAILDTDNQTIIVSCSTNDVTGWTPDHRIMIWKSDWSSWVQVSSITALQFNQKNFTGTAPGFITGTALAKTPSTIFLVYFYAKLKEWDILGGKQPVWLYSYGALNLSTRNGNTWAWSLANDFQGHTLPACPTRFDAVILNYNTPEADAYILAEIEGDRVYTRFSATTPNSRTYRQGLFLPGYERVTTGKLLSLNEYPGGAISLMVAQTSGSYQRHYIVSAIEGLNLADYTPSNELYPYDVLGHSGYYDGIWYHLTTLWRSYIYSNGVHLVINVCGLSTTIYTTGSNALASPWSKIQLISGATNTAIGAGEVNANILGSTITSKSLVNQHFNQRINGVRGWYPPSLDEMQKVWEVLGNTDQKRAQNGLINAEYWTSSEVAFGVAYAVALDNTYAAVARNTREAKRIVLVRMFYAQDSFTWTETYGSVSGTSQKIESGKEYALGSYGVKIKFAKSVGHRREHQWTFRQGEMNALSIKDKNGFEYFKAGGGDVSLIQKTRSLDTADIHLLPDDETIIVTRDIQDYHVNIFIPTGLPMGKQYRILDGRTNRTKNIQATINSPDTLPGGGSTKVLFQADSTEYDISLIKISDTAWAIQSTRGSGIVKKGTNSNGTYILFLDGTAIMWGKVIMQPQALNTQQQAVWNLPYVLGTTDGVNIQTTPLYQGQGMGGEWLIGYRDDNGIFITTFATTHTVLCSYSYREQIGESTTHSILVHGRWY